MSYIDFNIKIKPAEDFDLQLAVERLSILFHEAIPSDWILQDETIYIREEEE